MDGFELQLGPRGLGVRTALTDATRRGTWLAVGQPLPTARPDQW
jgi:hypothetical protein